jgi:hypothetical protein
MTATEPDDLPIPIPDTPRIRRPSRATLPRRAPRAPQPRPVRASTDVPTAVVVAAVVVVLGVLLVLLLST